MLVILKPDSIREQVERLITRLEEQGAAVRTGAAGSRVILELGGDTSRLDADCIASLDMVEAVRRMRTPFKMASREAHPADTVISVGGVQVGGGSLTVIAGPCAVESEQQTVALAKAVKTAGASMLRGGAFKPRTSPYSFQGLGARGLAYLESAREETGLPVVSELTDADQLPLFRNVDILQVGARNMQNFELLKALGRQEKPVLIKRGPSATYEEWLMSAEYVLSGGNPNVILCERGIRTFEPYTRNTLDLSAVPVLRRLTHLPVIVDPSHAAGKRYLVAPLASGAVAAGCDGLLIEVHNDPARALSDGAQSLRTEDFQKLMQKLAALHTLIQAQ